MPTPIFICGAECGVAAANAAAIAGAKQHWSTFGAATSVQSGGGLTAGAWSLRAYKFNPAAAVTDTLAHLYNTAIASPATTVVRFKVMFTTLPNAIRTICSSQAGLNGVRYNPTGTKLEAWAGAATATFAGSFIPDTNKWYTIEAKFVAGTTHTTDWKVNGVAMSQASKASQTAATSTGIAFGSNATGSGGNAAATATYYIDDIFVSATAGDFGTLMGGQVAGLFPTGDGTHAFTTGDFGDTAGTNIATGSTTAYQLVDDLLNGSADFIQQKVIRSTLTNPQNGYIEVTLADSPADLYSVNGVEACVGYHASSSTNTNTADVYLADAAGSANFKEVLGAGAVIDVSQTGYTTVSRAIPTNLTNGTWDKATVDALRMRMGYATDVTPLPYFDQVMVEVDYQPKIYLKNWGSIANGASPRAVTIPAAVAGNLLVICASSTTDPGSAPTINNSAVICNDGSADATVLAGTTRRATFFEKVAAGGETGFTVTLAGATIELQVYEYVSATGWPANPVDKIAMVTGGSGSVSSLPSASVTTDGAFDEVLVAMAALAAFTLPTMTGGFTVRTSVANSEFSGDQIVTAAGTYATTMGWTTARVACGGLVSFKPVVAANSLALTQADVAVAPQALDRTAAVSLAATPVSVPVTPQLLGITNVVAGADLALTPVTVAVAAQALARTLGLTSVPVTPVTVAVTAQALGRTGAVSLAATPASIAVTAQALARTVGLASPALAPVTVPVTPQALARTAAVSLAVTPATIAVTAAALARTAGGVTSALTPVTVALAAQALDRAAVSSLALSPAAIAVTAQALDRTVGAVTLPVAPAVIALAAQALDRTGAVSLAVTSATVAVTAQALARDAAVTLPLSASTVTVAPQPAGIAPGAAQAALAPVSVAVSAAPIDRSAAVVIGAGPVTITTEVQALDRAAGGVTPALAPVSAAVGPGLLGLSSAVSLAASPAVVQVVAAALGYTPAGVAVPLAPVTVQVLASLLNLAGVAPALELALTPATVQLVAQALGVSPGAVSAALAPVVVGVGVEALGVSAAVLLPLAPAGVSLEATPLALVPGGVTLALAPGLIVVDAGALGIVAGFATQALALDPVELAVTALALGRTAHAALQLDPALLALEPGVLAVLSGGVALGADPVVILVDPALLDIATASLSPAETIAIAHRLRDRLDVRTRRSGAQASTRARESGETDHHGSGLYVAHHPSDTLTPGEEP